MVICAAGFYIAGWGAQFTCDRSGLFRGDLPLCQPATCSALPDDITFTSTCSSISMHENCSASCRSGFEQNSSILTCDVTGTLTGQLPSCRPQTCPVPMQLQHPWYAHDCTTLSYGRSCSVVCASGFQSQGPGEQWQCALNGSEPALIGQLPHCSAAACDTGYPPRNAIFKDNCTDMLNGQTCVQTCAFGYIPSSTAVDSFICNPTGVLTSIGSMAEEDLVCPWTAVCIKTY